MAILIKGMEMPKNCHLCLYSYLGRDYIRVFCGIDDHYIADLQQWDKPYFLGHKDDSCPIIPVPDHGDLIDRDMVLKKAWDVETFVDAVKYAPTIIPADKKTPCEDCPYDKCSIQEIGSCEAADKEGAE